jgi:predicted metal-dependent phosphotriesterase family hydrolase
MKAFILALMEKGITQAEIDIMAKKNPANLLGLAT